MLVLGPANASVNHHPQHPTRTCEDSDLTYLLLHAPWHHHTENKKQSPSEPAIEISNEAYLLQRPLPASHERSQHHDTRHHRYRSSPAASFAQPNTARPVAEWIAGTLSAVDRQTLLSLFARLGPQRSTADCSAVVSPQNATARARYLPDMPCQPCESIRCGM